MADENMVYQKVTITLPKETIQKLNQLAAIHQRTKSNMIRHLIENSK